MNKNFLVAALVLFAAASLNAHKASAQSCPNHEQFGVHSVSPIDRTLQSDIEVTYFTTTDPHVFLSEKAGIHRSASYTRLNTTDYLAKMERLVNEGVASVKKQQSAAAYLGEIAELNLERNRRRAEAQTVDANMAATNPNYVYQLDRRTEISVRKGSSVDGDYYRVGVVSWFVDATESGGQQIADYDASVLMKPGETAIFKLMSDYEIKRSGADRSYIAITMRSVNNMSAASLESRRTVVALKR
jgi:hypothetical protein